MISAGFGKESAGVVILSVCALYAKPPLDYSFPPETAASSRPISSRSSAARSNSNPFAASFISWRRCSIRSRFCASVMYLNTGSSTSDGVDFFSALLKLFRNNNKDKPASSSMFDITRPP